MSAVELYNASVDVLNASVAVLDASSPLRAPERRYVSVGEPAFDCDQLTVSASVRPGLVATNSIGLDAVRSHARPRVLIASCRPPPPWRRLFRTTASSDRCDTVLGWVGHPYEQFWLSPDVLAFR